MANTLYDWAREKFLQGGINWDSDVIKCALMDTAGYQPNFSTHKNLNDVSAAGFIAPVNGTPGGVTLLEKTSIGGAADARDVTFTAVSGAQSEALLLYVDTGVPSTSTLIAWIDSATGLPITPNGGDIIVVWDQGTNRIFRL